MRYPEGKRQDCCITQSVDIFIVFFNIFYEFRGISWYLHGISFFIETIPAVLVHESISATQAPEHIFPHWDMTWDDALPGSHHETHENR